MAPKSVTFRRHDHLVSVLFGDLLSHSYNITFSMFLYLVPYRFLHIHSLTSCRVFTIVSTANALASSILTFPLCGGTEEHAS